MNKRLIFSLIIAFNSHNIFSQISTDRPDQTDSAFVMPKGEIQVESGISFENSQSNINALFRFGLVKGVEIRLNSNYLINDQLSFMKKSSFSDFKIGAKFKIFDKMFDKTKLALLSNISIPTARESFSNNAYGFLTKVNISHELSGENQLGYNIGYNKFEDQNGQILYTIVYSRSLNSFGVFFEIFGDKSSVDSNLNFDSGITYLLNKTQQLDLSIGKGLNNNLFFVSLGFSVNFN